MTFWKKLFGKTPSEERKINSDQPIADGAKPDLPLKNPKNEGDIFRGKTRDEWIDMCNANSSMVEQIDSIIKKYENAIFYREKDKLSELVPSLQKFGNIMMVRLLLIITDEKESPTWRCKIARFVLVYIKDENAAMILFNIFVKGKNPAELYARSCDSLQDQATDNLYHTIRTAMEELGYSFK